MVEGDRTVESPIVLRGGEISDVLGGIITRPTLVLIALALSTLIQIFRYGGGTRYWLLFLGAGLANACLLAFGLLVTVGNSWGGSVRNACVRVCGFAPYLFGCYLIFFEGFWRLRVVVEKFSLSTLIVLILCMVGGYIVVNGAYRLSELALQVQGGQILIKNE